MDKKSKKKSIKNPPEKSKPEPKQPQKSHDLPAVQCKDTLLLDYDHNAQYSKRKLISNWNRYDEPSDEEDNAQMSAADFEQLLSASKSVGDHFTFASERNWLQGDDTQTVDLFKLDIGTLKNGVGRLPFYIRQGISKETFTEGELTDMDCRVNFFETEPSKAKENVNQNLLNILSDSKPKSKSQPRISPRKVQEVDPLDELLQKTTISNKSSSHTPVAMKAPAMTQQTADLPLASTSAKPVKNEKKENIQDWLDDILNES